MPKGELLGVDCQTGGINLTAHASRKGRELCVTVINRDATDADAVIKASGYTRGRACA